MDIKLSQPFAPNSAVAPFDVLQVKKGLNRLGYYTPLATTGMTDIPDTAVFSALKKFQKDFGLVVTGMMNPNDATLRLLNLEISKTPKGHYIWHTVGDDRVRPSHAVLDNTIRSWTESPNPSQDFGCRCWAELAEIPEDINLAFKDVAKILETFDSNEYTLSAKLLRYYLKGTGAPIQLKANELEDSKIVNSAISKNKKRFEDSFIGREQFGEYYKPNSFFRTLINLKENNPIKLSDYWDVDVSWLNQNIITDPDFSRAIGSGKIRSKGDFQLSRKGDIIKIKGTINHQINDFYDFNTDTVLDRKLFGAVRLLADKGYAKPFTVNWESSQPFTGAITLRNKKIFKATFE